MQPTRFSVDGMRFYRTDQSEKCYASVTTILGKTAGESSRKALLTWNEKNPGGLEAAAARGSAVHLACENYIRGLPVEISEEHAPFWDGLSDHLDRFDGFIWSERPLLPEHQFCTGEDGISRIWSHRYGYCGCPDIIGLRRGVMLLSDFKSSNGPYSRWYPKEDNRQYFGGYMKYRKCAMQLAAYRLAAEETLGIRIHAAQIIATTPSLTQNFFIHGDELKRWEYKWLQKVEAFYEMRAQEKAASEDVAPAFAV
jgi:hypothetical protein